MKSCSQCREEKPPAAFFWKKGRPRAECKACHAARAAARYGSDPERFAREMKAYRLRRNCGLTLEDYEAMEAAQNGLCAICGLKPQRLVLDHCHASGKPRGLLCDSCNKGLGHFQDDPRRIAAAASYLEASRG